MQRIVDSVTAEGVIVYDLSTNKVLASKNTDRTYSLASLTKIVTAAAIYEMNPNTLNELRDMLKISSNEEADRLAMSLGQDEESKAKYITRFANKYGLSFRNVTGLDTEDMLPGGEGKPMGILNFSKDYYLKYPELFDDTLDKEDNTNIITDELSFLSISKTGFTNLSGGNLLVGVQKGLGREIFILVLNSTEKNRFVDVQNIARFLVQSSI